MRVVDEVLQATPVVGAQFIGASLIYQPGVGGSALVAVFIGDTGPMNWRSARSIGPYKMTDFYRYHSSSTFVPLALLNTMVILFTKEIAKPVLNRRHHLTRCICRQVTSSQPPPRVDVPGMCSLEYLYQHPRSALSCLSLP